MNKKVKPAHLFEQPPFHRPEPKLESFDKDASENAPKKSFGAYFAEDEFVQTWKQWIEENR